ncbi:toll/interleukin-1 receptor domain-containing protein [uncultured Methanobrevibacter sp.]|uniref:toll/interleukin-1 receptor domain-containing protein n=1 Tax=uncultured Methanobrevibacter sp. TaxID=253161 RepID=UPI00260FFA19|nr:toll/interleukin-1 receptor domain-containing protein [uncultured Methanobrevibacter sp.]
MAHDVFISYSTKDKVVADAICHVLEENGIPCWIAPRNITSGKHYAEEISNAIKSTELVVLVFSENSQNSQFVQNEIKLAFSKNKTVISFGIDESLPKDDLEYYLKTTHWLIAFPKPEEVFGDLVNDASKLLGKEKINPFVDSNVIERAQNGEFNQPNLKNEWKSLILMFTPFYSLALLYMGYSSRMKKLVKQGVLCLIPLVFYVNMFFFGPYFIEARFIQAIFIILLWIVSLVYFFIIRKEYLFRKTIIKSVSDDNKLFDALINEYGNV